MTQRKTQRTHRVRPAVFPSGERGPSPVPFLGALSTDLELARHRRPYCAHYSACLDRSVKEGWDGFTCSHCPLRDEAPATPASERFAHERRRSQLGS